MNGIGYLERKRVYEQAVESYGCRTQVMMAIEEMSELTKAICKVFRPDCDGSNEEIAEEIADVTICLEQLRLIFGLNEDVCDQMDKKILRLAERLGFDTEDFEHGD